MPPLDWVALGLEVEQWPQALEKMQAIERDAFWNYLDALFRHFDLEVGAFKDLALSLAYRHERDELVKGKAIHFRALYVRYGIDPLDEIADAKLALLLADRYVRPELNKAETPGGDWGTRLSTPDLARLAYAVFAVEHEFHKRQRKISARAIADILRDKKKLSKILPANAVKGVEDALNRRGNKATGGIQMSSDTWLRQTLIPMVLNSQNRPGKAENRKLYAQLVCDALPMLKRAELLA